MAILYLDSSALVKLAVPEPESRALRELLGSWPERASSVISRVEVLRAAASVGGTAATRARNVLDRIALVEIDDAVVEGAASLAPAHLRTLDAIHLATALSLGEELAAICAYDARLTEAAASAGIEVFSPA